MNSTNSHPRSVLQRIARSAMAERGLLPDFSRAALNELAGIRRPAALKGAEVRDLTDLLWASIDNDDSRDLDQLTYAEVLTGDLTKIMVAVADVDSLVKDDSAIDRHARHNTTSVYTAALVFPMLPENLSTNLTSLNFNEERLSMVVEMIIGLDGSMEESDIYPAQVRNHARLAYNSVAAWLEGEVNVPESVTAIAGLESNLRLQDKAAQRIRHLRHRHGALTFETIQAKALFEGEELRDIGEDRRNRAKDIIEDFMIAANGATARFLESRQFPSLRRVVRSPKRWERIVEIADEHGFRLPPAPDSSALEEFLTRERVAEPLTFPDLSLSIIKLLGAGEYVAEPPGSVTPGHFGLAVRDYTHSTAPNRRYPDLITQRLLKAAIGGSPVPYGNEELDTLARHCTAMEDAANKVERQVTKSAAAMLLKPRIGERFDAIVTGSGPKGTWARLLYPPVEGKLAESYEGMDVGYRIRVELIQVNVERGFIDFRRV